MHSGQIFVLAIIAMGMFSGMISTWVRARHGYPLEDRRDARPRMWGAFGGCGNSRSRYRADPQDEAERKIVLLSSENERLTGKIGRLEERIAVLERIATDPAERTAREIEALRNRD